MAVAEPLCALDHLPSGCLDGLRAAGGRRMDLSVRTPSCFLDRFSACPAAARRLAVAAACGGPRGDGGHRLDQHRLSAGIPAGVPRWRPMGGGRRRPGGRRPVRGDRAGVDRVGRPGPAPGSAAGPPRCMGHGRRRHARDGQPGPAQSAGHAAGLGPAGRRVGPRARAHRWRRRGACRRLPFAGHRDDRLTHGLGRAGDRAGRVLHLAAPLAAPARALGGIGPVRVFRGLRADGRPAAAMGAGQCRFRRGRYRAHLRANPGRPSGPCFSTPRHNARGSVLAGAR